VLHQSLQKEQSAELALFADDDFDLSEKLSFNVGMRYTEFMNFGPGVVYNYAEGFQKTKIQSLINNL